ncbi:MULTISPECIES: site-specific DNA-methyltransferase [unclassified Rathayibacter]|uniref:site-specific DNA-methyltransferase n=1 Tax=unclassified Rathayibacter TaxID=2609250 RepID=UPI0011B00C2F|nr:MULTISPECIES: site-specific DNA-methyltransferase [unclassified Rathayibacter]
MTRSDSTISKRPINYGMTGTLDLLQRKYSGTPLDVSFRDLVGPLPADELTHGLYPYPARLLRQIPRMLLQCEQIVGGIERIVDPFCGAGTVLVEAQRAGLPSSGIEQNPIGALASRVKTTLIDSREFTDLANEVLQSAKYTRRRASTPRYLERWYSEEAHSALARLTSTVSQHSGQLADALFLALALTARKVANTDRRIPVPVRPRVPLHFTASDVWSVWINEIGRISQAVRRIGPINERPRVIHADARSEDAWSRAVDQERALIFTSPPYGAAQKYVRSTSLELGWLGHASDRGTIALEGGSIGREHLSASERLLARDHLFGPLVEQAVSAAREASPERGAIYATYFADMQRVLGLIGARGARVVLISGTNTVGKLELDTYSLLGEMLLDNGLKRTLSLRDEIRGRALMTARRYGTRPARAEYIEVFEREI